MEKIQEQLDAIVSELRDHENHIKRIGEKVVRMEVQLEYMKEKMDRHTALTTHCPHKDI